MIGLCAILFRKSAGILISLYKIANKAQLALDKDGFGLLLDQPAGSLSKTVDGLSY